MMDGALLTIAHVLAPARYGGLERVVRALALGHAERGHRMHVVHVIEEHDSGVPIVFGDPRVASHIVRPRRRRYWRERAEVRALCARVGAEVVHTHGYRPDVVDSGIASSIGAIRVTTVHGFTGGGMKNRLFEKLQIRAFRRFDAVVPVSDPLKQSLTRHGVPSERLHLIRNAWLPPSVPPLARAEARATLGIPQDAVVVGWVGRLSHEKGPDVLLDAMSFAPPDLSAVFLGDGPLLPILRERATAAGLRAPDRARWAGGVEEASRFFSAFDVFALTSRTEGTPIVLFEAMAARIPIVATRVGGVPDVVSEREALLVQSEDPRAVAEAIRSTISDPAGAQRRAAAAAARLGASYRAVEWLDAYEHLYYRSIERRRHAGASQRVVTPSRP